MTEKNSFTVGASGLYLVGEIAGVKQDTFQTDQGQRLRHTLGMRIEIIDAYGGAEKELVEVRLPQDAVDRGVARQLDGLRGQIISCPVWVQAWTGKRGAGYSLMLDSKQAILGI
ncbi:DNA-binding protein [Aeromonas caviae]|uniref:DNA-binding protein n=1 Tax=Aeromonas caviae TaxID=648 RepID=UPI002B4A2988|nr:DNA-binding protein [Aeromonas caviae]